MHLNTTLRRNVVGWLLCLPALLIFGSFFIGPALVGLYVSFFSWNGSSPHLTFIGAANYSSILSDARFWNAFGVTIGAIAAMLLIMLPLALLLAIGLSAPGWGKRFFRTAFFLPYVLSTTTVAVIWIFLLDPYQGLLNGMLRGIGLPSVQQGWLGQGSTALPSVLVGAIWWAFGLYVVLFMAGLASIPSEYYDAVRLETNSKLRIARSITIPMLREQIFIACVMTIGSVFGYLSGFILLLTGGGPAGRTETLGLFSYWTAFRGLEVGKASAISVIVLATVFVVIIFPTLRLAHERLEF